MILPSLSDIQGMRSASLVPSASAPVLCREQSGDREHVPVRSVMTMETEHGCMLSREASSPVTGMYGMVGDILLGQCVGSVPLMQNSRGENSSKCASHPRQPDFVADRCLDGRSEVKDAKQAYRNPFWKARRAGCGFHAAEDVSGYGLQLRGEAGTCKAEAEAGALRDRPALLEVVRAAVGCAAEQASSVSVHTSAADRIAWSPSPPAMLRAYDETLAIWDVRGAHVSAQRAHDRGSWTTLRAALSGHAGVAARLQLAVISCSLDIAKSKSGASSWAETIESQDRTRTYDATTASILRKARSMRLRGSGPRSHRPAPELAAEGLDDWESRFSGGGLALDVGESASEPGCSHTTRVREASLVTAAVSVQRRWRAKHTHAQEQDAIQALGWSRKQLRAHGPVEANARFLQDLFRETRRRHVRAWSRGGMCGQGRRFPQVQHRCGGGANLATEGEWDRQKQIGHDCLEFYSTYVKILARLQKGSAIGVLHSFCGGGGSTEGVKRAGGPVGQGIDNAEQVAYQTRFGSECFTCGDALDWSLTSGISQRHDLRACFASPPCKWYSTARRKDQRATQPPLIPETRNMLQALFDFWAIENVAGAKAHMHEGAVELHGSLFGLQVARARLFETNFKVVIDAAISVPAVALRERTCLGRRRRWKRVDKWGRPEGPCCPGNLYAVQGTQPYHCTAAECAGAMGVELDHMPYDRLAQAIPPAYSQLIYGQLCMRVLERDYGMRVVTFDEHLEDVTSTTAYLRGWLRGAGDPASDAGLGFVSVETTDNPDQVGEALLDGGSEAEQDAEFRELYYSKYGGFESRWGARRDRHPLDCLRPHQVHEPEAWDADLLKGKNTLLQGRPELVRAWAPTCSQAAAAEPGTRITVLAKRTEAERLYRLGYKHTGLQVGELTAFAIGRRGLKRTERLDHDEAERLMDPRDQGIGKEPKQAIRERAWKHMNTEGGFWRDKGLPDRIEEYMTHGVGVTLLSDQGGYEVAQYPYASSEARAEAAMETDRAIAVGHLSYVPSEEADAVRQGTCVHPWTMAFNGEKWRACQDYSVGTNRLAASSPFGLPTPWDVRRMIKPDTHFVKYDLRDGFWRVPVKAELRKRLVLRHPANGKLVWCNSLPFGFVDSPRAFCLVTEAVAQEWRRRVAERFGGEGGLYILCYVDDYLLIGDNAALVRQGGAMFEELLHELGIEWAPHKQRGPSRVMEFLGLLLCNLPGRSVIGLSRARQSKLLGMLAEWMRRRPRQRYSPEQVRQAEADPKQLAKLLGHLVFASQVVPGGRVYMQGMLRQFAGLEIDWRRGLVRWSGSHRQEGWKKVGLSEGFWEDLEWWQSHLESRNCTPLVPPVKAEAAVTGTDASDWGTGQAAFLDGGLEEARLRFTAAERRHPINWRELLGITRIFEWYGHRLQGRTVLVETDNMAARGGGHQDGIILRSL